MYKLNPNQSYFGRFTFLFMLFLLIAFSSKAQKNWISEIHWTILMDGLQYAELDAPEKSVVNDSKLTILKVDVREFDFKFLTASEHGKHPRTAPDWAQEFDQNIIINAGMNLQQKAGRLVKLCCDFLIIV